MAASYKTTFYECGCDYKSIHAGSARICTQEEVYVDYSC